MHEQETILEALKSLKEIMLEKSKPTNPYVGLGNLKHEGYDLTTTIEQKFLFHQSGPFSMEVGFIPQGIVGMLVSPGGCGKTYALMQCAVAAGSTILGLQENSKRFLLQPKMIGHFPTIE
jgi:hypothetical protein